MIYEPREDSYLLQNNLKNYVKKKSVLDMGSGSGIQAESALILGAKSVLAVDINTGTVKHLKSKNLNTLRSDLFSNVKGKFDVILFNPPYLPIDPREDSESAEVTAGGKRGDEITLRFLKSARQHLNAGGVILLVVSSLTPQDRINSAIKKLKFKKKVIATTHIFLETLDLLELKLQ